MNKSRLDQIINRLKSSQFDLLVLNPGPGLLYATGLQFHLMERPTLLVIDRSGRAGMILPELERGKVNGEIPGMECFTYGDDPSTWQASISLAFRSINPRARLVGVEPARLRYLELEYIRNSLPAAELSPADSMLGALRMRKDQSELELMRKAVRIAEQAFERTLPVIKAGITEQAVAAELTVNMLRLGSETELPFPPIVAGGPNSANPHAVPGERQLQSGDMVVIDWGASYKGYFSDLTRTVAIGAIDPELLRVYEAVQNANIAGRNAGRPGIPAGEVDRAGRAVIEDAGFGAYFNHRIGHGLGLEAHEEPYMYGANAMLLEPGNVYTVEPGIYLPGRGGVRIEDDMVVTAEGSESLSTLGRGLINIPA